MSDGWNTSTSVNYHIFLYFCTTTASKRLVNKIVYSNILVLVVKTIKKSTQHLWLPIFQFQLLCTTIHNLMFRLSD